MIIIIKVAARHSMHAYVSASNPNMQEEEDEEEEIPLSCLRAAMLPWPSICINEMLATSFS